MNTNEIKAVIKRHAATLHILSRTQQHSSSATFSKLTPSGVAAR